MLLKPALYIKMDPTELFSDDIVEAALEDAFLTQDDFDGMGEVEQYEFLSDYLNKLEESSREIHMESYRELMSEY